MFFGRTHEQYRAELNEYLCHVCEWRDTFLLTPAKLQDGSWAWLETVEKKFIPHIFHGRGFKKTEMVGPDDLYYENFSYWIYRRKAK